MEMSHGELVLCRSFADQPLVRAVWSTAKEGVLIGSKENLNVARVAREANIDPTVALAPFDAVYEYDEYLFRQLDELFRQGRRGAKLEKLWQRAKPYKICSTSA